MRTVRGKFYEAMHTEKYRYITNIREEGFEFYLVLKYIVHFYTTIMKGQILVDWLYPSYHETIEAGHIKKLRQQKEHFKTRGLGVRLQGK